MYFTSIFPISADFGEIRVFIGISQYIRDFAFIFYIQLSSMMLSKISYKNPIDSNFKKLPLLSHFNKSSRKPCLIVFFLKQQFCMKQFCMTEEKEKVNHCSEDLHSFLHPNLCIILTFIFLFFFQHWLAEILSLSI